MTKSIHACGFLAVISLCLPLAFVAGCGSDADNGGDKGKEQAKKPLLEPPTGPGPKAVSVPFPPVPPGRDGNLTKPVEEEPAGANPDEPAAGEEATASPPIDKPQQDPPAQVGDGSNPDEEPEDSIPPREEPKPLEPPPEADGLKRFVDDNDLWVDVKNKRVVLAGRVVQRSEHVPLELFVCRKGTKEHEAIVSVQVTAFFVHACLVAAGGEFGHPVRFWTVDRKPMYEAAEGCVVKVTVYWDDEDGKRRSMPAQQWLHNSRTESAMQEPWVFAGSQFYKPTPEDKPFYLAEDGDLICVSNFPSALLDVPVESSSEESHLLYRPLTENIPAVGTPVALVLEPEAGLREPISAPRVLEEAPVEPPADLPEADAPATQAPADDAPPAEPAAPESP